jgi:nucleotide-binding universal stress UspA family protein
MIRRILVPVDFSNPSLQALDYAIEFGRPFKPEFIVLHVLEPIYLPGPSDLYGPGYDMGLVYRELERAGREQLARVAATLQKKRLTTRTLLRVGTAYHVIVETAKKLKADLIVMSTHGRTGLSHVLMGSVAERVVRSAACPVLTVRGQKPGRRPSPRRGGGTRRPSRRRAGRAVLRSRSMG